MKIILLILAAYLFMEFMAWFTHKYVMHGFLWKWHKDHHRKDGKEYLPQKTEEWQFEKNDLFFLIFAIPAMILMITGFIIPIHSLIFISIGITLYGLTYFLIHDIVIHKRLDVARLQKIKNPYLKAVIKAHIDHHNPKSTKGFKNFGLLIFPIQYLRLK